MNLVTVE